MFVISEVSLYIYIYMYVQCSIRCGLLAYKATI